jgi:hypothetical protein
MDWVENDSGYCLLRVVPVNPTFDQSVFVMSVFFKWKNEYF